MISFLEVEWLKTRRSLIRWIVFLSPIIISGCAVSYLIYRKDISNYTIYQSFFSIWSACIIPIGVGIITGYLIYEENLANSFNIILSNGINRKKFYLAKFLFSIIAQAVCTFLAVIILCLGMNVLNSNNLDIALFLKASLFSIIGTLPIMAIHLIISFIFGMGASIGAGICGFLVATFIGTTAIGDNIWMFIPWSYPVKMSMIPYILQMNNTELLAQIQSQINLLFLLSIILGAIFLIVGVIWYNNCEIRDNVVCPIIFLSARQSETDKIRGFNLGGDDYITKPFGLRELLAKIEANLRREKRSQYLNEENKRRKLYFGNLSLDIKDRVVEVCGKNIPLTKTEYEIVELLALNAGQVFTKEQIYEKVWGYDKDGDNTTVVEMIKKIRKKFSTINDTEQYISTVWGIGYKWNKR